jgi:ankyrin repeat protein
MATQSPVLWTAVSTVAGARHIAANVRVQLLLELQQLLDQPGCLVNERGGREKSTPLDIAVRCSDFETTMMLLDHGADTNMPSTHIATPMHRCASGTNDRHRNMIGSTQETPDNVLVDQHNRHRIMLELLKRGADVNSRLQLSNETPLHCAVRFAHNIAAVRTLLQHNADVSARDNSGYTALARTIEGFHRVGSAEMALCLLEHGADINEIRQDGSTLLHLSVINRHDTCLAEIAFLIKHGARDLQDNDGMTAADLALSHQAQDLALYINEQFEERRRCYLAFVMGTHDRLGQCSDVRGLVPELVLIILNGHAVHQTL